MANNFSSNSVEHIRRLVDLWCERRALHPLSEILPGYLAFNGLTDGWVNLYEAINATRAYEQDMPTAEIDLLHQARTEAWQVLKRLGVDPPA